MITIALIGTGGIAHKHLQSWLLFPDRCRVALPIREDNPFYTLHGLRARVPHFHWSQRRRGERT